MIAARRYDDGRSDAKGVEPEGVVLGKVSERTIAFIGLERVDAVAVYDVTNPYAPPLLAAVTQRRCARRISVCFGRG